MSTPHIDAENGDVARTVLLPGDPLRAKFIADHFLTEVTCYSRVRDAYGFTGNYQGHRVSVQATGMGMPSIGIYATELVKFFGVENLIRVGTAGAISTDVHVRDLVLSQGASSGQSGYVSSFFDKEIDFAPIADFKLLSTAARLAETAELTYHVGNTIGVDRFYNDDIENQTLADFGILATEMEIPALYTVAAQYHKRALGILTISDHMVTGETTTPQERQTTFTDMMTLALDTAVQRDVESKA